MKQPAIVEGSGREWLWRSYCPTKAKEREGKHSCPWCYLRFPEEEVLREARRK
jgi:hypothetical protein